MAVNDWCGYLAENQRIINVEELVCCSLAQHAMKPMSVIGIKKYIQCITLISVGECLNNHNKKQRTIKNYNTLQRYSSQAFTSPSLYARPNFVQFFYRATPGRAQYCYGKSSVCLSVCPSVALRYHGYIGWNTSKIFSWLLCFLLSDNPNTTYLLQREHPKFWVE